MSMFFNFGNFFSLPRIFFSFVFIVLFLPLSIDTYHYLSYTSSVFKNYSRIDFSITNSDYFTNIEFINADQFIEVSKPDWIKTKFGWGGIVVLDQNLLGYKKHKIKLKANSNCSVLISFRGLDRRLNNIRYPVFSKYKDIVINNEKLNIDNAVATHDKSITTKITLKKDEVIELTFSSKKHFPHISDFDAKPNISYSNLFLTVVVALMLGSIIGKNYNKYPTANSTERKRIVYYDFLRIFSILFVIYNHTDGFHYYLRGIDKGITEYCHIMLSVFTKFAVPMFFVITGALLLEKNDSIKIILKKRLFRIFVIIAVFTILSCNIEYLVSGKTYNLSDIFRGLLRGNISAPGVFSYWFLYAYMGILIVLPFLKEIATFLNREKFALLFTLVVILNVLLPLLNLALKYFNITAISLHGSFENVIGYFAGTSIFYVLLGYYLDKKVDINKLRKNHYMLLSLSFLIAIVVASFATIIDNKINMKFSQNYLMSTMPFIIVPLFLFVKKCFMACKFDNIFSKIIPCIGPLIFFVYLFDGILKYCIYECFFNSLVMIVPSVSKYPVLYSMLWGITSISISSIICYFLRKSPFMRKFI